jgi:long-chain fatty acid transport protein
MKIRALCNRFAASTAFALVAATFSGSAVMLAAPASAHASGYLTARFGSDQGTPATPNGFAVYFNPAALGGTTGTTLTGDLALLVRHVSYDRPAEALSPNDPGLRKDPNYVAANTGRASLTNLLALPFLGVNTDFGSKWLRGGWAVYVPFGGLATWDRKDLSANPQVPGAVDGPQRWHNISGQILAVYNTFALAAVLGKGFSVGASASAIIHTASTVRARNLDGSDDTTSPGGLVEGRSLVTAHGFNIGVAGGVYYEPEDKRFRLGLSYTSQPGFGETVMAGELTQYLGNGPKGGVQQIDLRQTYPDIWRFGASQKLGSRWTLNEDVEYVRWSVFDKQCVTVRGAACNLDASETDIAGGKNVVLNIPRKWRDAVGMRIGPQYQLNDTTELFGSVGISTPAVPKSTIDASTIDALRLYVTLGAKFDLSKKFSLAASYNHIAFKTVEVSAKEAKQSTYQRPTGGPNESTSPSAAGTYASQIGMVNVNFAYRF